METEKLYLSRNISAIQVMENNECGNKLGLITQLGAGGTIELCEEGFNDKTAKVRMHSNTYFVFTEDVDSLRGFAVVP